VVNEAYDRRWTAEADGRAVPVYPTNVVMRGMLIPPGVSRVTLRYRSVAGDTVWYLAIALPLLLAAAVIVGIRRRRAARPPS
jgi:LPXTG-motif cell wall-anchored protein